MKYFVYCRKSIEAEDRQILSIESQLTALKRAFGEASGIDFTEVYEEAFSAKAPGRTRFNDMLARIERGEAQGIVAWAPDRLARNSIDGGRIIYLLDRGVLRDLKFATYTFENNSQGKFMLQIMFGQSKYYSDALSENVKRGNRTKVEKGWRPNQAPLGYLNDPVTKTIVRDPVHFPLIRRMFDLMLTGSYSPKDIAVMARDEWGFRTPKRRRTGGVPLAMSSVYHTFGNPFYAGIIVWNGERFQGKHEPVITIEELERVSSLLKRPGPARPQKHVFPFTGMIRCGSCGRQVTAEKKVNRFGTRYVYYHCSRRQLRPRCPERSIEASVLEQQIVTFLQGLSIEEPFEVWMIDQLAHREKELAAVEQARRKSLERSATDVSAQLSELTGIRLRGLLSDEEFMHEREGLQNERLRLQSKMAETSAPSDPIEPLESVILFLRRAADWFLRGDHRAQRLILQTVGSNLILASKILSIQAVKPLRSLFEFSTSPSLLATSDDVRTFSTGKRAERRLQRWTEEMHTEFQEPDGQRMLRNIRLLREMFEPEDRDAHRARRDRAA